MQSLLIVAATPFEIEAVINALQPAEKNPFPFLNTYTYNQLKVDVAITGAGMVNTAFCMGQLIGRKYDGALNAGICGSFRDDIKIGDVVNVTSDCFSDFGAQDGNGFLSISQINLGQEHVIPAMSLKDKTLADLKPAKGITVNTVHGNENAIQSVVSRLAPDVESMEGAAFLMACNAYKWPCAQIRAVSNKVEKRDRSKWDIPLAIKKLEDVLLTFLKSNG